MPDLSELIARVEGLEGLDARTMIGVARVVLPQAYPGGWLLDSELSDWRYLKFEKFVEAEAWESAALALVTRVLPGWHAHMGTDHYGDPDDAKPAWARAFPGHGRMSEGSGNVAGTTIAIALILALLRALAAKEPS